MSKIRIGINWWLRQKLRIEELEHLVDDLRIHNRVLKHKLKKLKSRKT